MVSKKDNIIKAICIILIIVAIIVFLAIFYGKDSVFIYEDHLKENVLTISNRDESDRQEDISLQEMTYYIINVEGDFHDAALKFNSKYPEKYWMVKVKPMYNMKDYAKDLSIDSCVRDNVYYLEALKQGVELTDEEIKLAEKDTRTILENISSKQMNVSEFSYDVVYDIEEKLYVATKYVNMLVEQGHTMEELELEGSYYKQLLEKYNVDINDKLWDRVKLGNLTITK